MRGADVGVRQSKVAVHDLEIGMFVSDLDRPWHRTPFPIQGFHIRSQADIQALTAHCRWVMVDVAESRDDAASIRKNPGQSAQRKLLARAGNGREQLQLPPLSIRESVRYQIVTPLRKEVKTAHRLLNDAEMALARTFETIPHGHKPDFRPVAELARKMVASVTRQPNALLWLSRTRHYDDFVYRHALNMSVWALVCGRQLGLNEGLLQHLGTGCLLSQVGKLSLPRDLLIREHRLDPDEYARYQTYVSEGVEKLHSAELSKAALAVVQDHRERHNGSGFPRGIRGDRIPLLAKVAGIAEFFESMVAPRETEVPLTPARAVSQLYGTRNIEFQEDLVEPFIQAIGVYPAGSLVELSDGRRGVVVAHSADRRLWPKVMVMQDGNRQPLKSARVIDLARFNSGCATSEVITVRECLPHGTEGLDPARFDMTGGESRWSLGRLFNR